MQNGLKISIPYKKRCYTVKQELECKELFNINKGNLKSTNDRYKSQILVHLVLNQKGDY